jgi:ABC-type nitrate/sulfonate/bicarbonate transport system permease component
VTSTTRPAHSVWRTNERLLLGVATVLFLLVFWEGLTRGWWADLLHPLLGNGAEKLRVRALFISSPTLVARKAWELYITTGEIWRHIGTSGLELAVGLGLATAIGIPLGLWAGRYRYASYALDPFVSALNATPQIAFLPLIILWIGTGFWARALIILLLALLPILINAHHAVRTVDPKLLKLARSFSSSEWRLFTTIILPSAVPFLLAGLRLAVGRAMIGIVVGELYGSAIGVGIMINKAGSLFQTDVVFVGVFTIVVAGLLLTELLRRIERRVEAWRPRGAGQSF